MTRTGTDKYPASCRTRIISTGCWAIVLYPPLGPRQELVLGAGSNHLGGVAFRDSPCDVDGRRLDALPLAASLEGLGGVSAAAFIPIPSPRRSFRSTAADLGVAGGALERGGLHGSFGRPRLAKGP
jgi:hypothetical protein